MSEDGCLKALEALLSPLGLEARDQGILFYGRHDRFAVGMVGDEGNGMVFANLVDGYGASLGFTTPQYYESSEKTLEAVLGNIVCFELVLEGEHVKSIKNVYLGCKSLEEAMIRRDLLCLDASGSERVSLEETEASRMVAK